MNRFTIFHMRFPLRILEAQIVKAVWLIVKLGRLLRALRSGSIRDWVPGDRNWFLLRNGSFVRKTFVFTPPPVSSNPPQSLILAQNIYELRKSAKTPGITPKSRSRACNWKNNKFAAIRFYTSHRIQMRPVVKSAFLYYTKGCVAPEKSYSETITTPDLRPLKKTDRNMATPTNLYIFPWKLYSFAIEFHLMPKYSLHFENFIQKAWMY